MAIKQLEDALQELIVKKHDKPVRLFMATGEYRKMKELINELDKQFRGGVMMRK